MADRKPGVPYDPPPRAPDPNDKRPTYDFLKPDPEPNDGGEEE